MTAIRSRESRIIRCSVPFLTSYKKFRLLIPFIIILSSIINARFDPFQFSYFSPSPPLRGQTHVTTAALHDANVTTNATHHSSLPSIHSRTPPRYAYVSLVAGCNPNDGIYRGFLYSVLLAIYNLHQSGSKADFIIMIQMAVNSHYSTLPENDLIPFLKLNQTMASSSLNPHFITFHYLPKPAAETFYQAMMTKFTILNWTRYSRILYMDADVLPYCNLDYFFAFSEAGILKPNVIVAAGKSPVNGGFFLLHPGAGEYDQLQSILRAQQQQAFERARAQHPHPFDPIQGWGHLIQPPHDYWMTMKKKKGYHWNFHAAFADQGLLYYWVKYVKRNVSIIICDVIEQWTEAPSSFSPPPPATKNLSIDSNDTTIVMLESNLSLTSLAGFGCNGTWKVRRKNAPNPYFDFHHYMGIQKPWELTGVPDDVPAASAQSMDAKQYWFHVLRNVNRTLDLGWNITAMFPMKHPNLGEYPFHHQMIQTARLLPNSKSSKNIVGQ